MSEDKGGFNYNLIIVVVLSVVLAMGSTYFMLSKIGVVGANKANSSNSNNAQKKLGPTTKIGEFLVNLSGGRRFIKVNIVFEVNNDKVVEEIKTRAPQIRDTVISILRTKDHKEITSDQGIRNLRTKIMKDVNKNLIEGKVTNVFFTEFVVQ